MSKRKDGADAKSEPAARATSAGRSDHSLPMIESPAISPGAESLSESADSKEVEAGEAAIDAAPAKPRTGMSPRRKRSAFLAASVVFAAAFGAAVGATANTYFAPTKVDTAAIDEHTAIQQTVGQLLKQMTAINTASIQAAGKAQKDIVALKAGLDTATKATTAQLATVTERLDRVEQLAKAEGAPETTGSIKPRHASVGANAGSSDDPAIVHGWIVRVTRNGLVYAEGRSGIYRIVPGVSLPNLGTVETIKRENGRWLVVTPKGIIVSMRGRASRAH